MSRLAPILALRRASVLALVLALVLAAPAGAAAPRASLPDVEDEVMCVECGTPLSVSQSPVADQERAFIRREIARGRTKEQIKTALVAEYGEAVLAEPRRGGVDLAAWVTPILLAVLAAMGVGLAARRWRATARGSEAVGAVAAPLDPAEARRLDAELRAFDR